MKKHSLLLACVLAMTLLPAWIPSQQSLTNSGRQPVATPTPPSGTIEPATSPTAAQAGLQATPTPPMPARLQGVTALAAGSSYTCALTNSGGVKCWGDHWPQGAADLEGLTSRVTAIAGGASHICAITGGGGVKCWGYNADGQLGDGTTTTQYEIPAEVRGLAGSVSVLAAGSYHTCAVTPGGVMCWGNNAGSQLGDGTATNRLTPVKVTGLAGDITALAAGHGHTCALTHDGGVRCWGNNWAGQLGNGGPVQPSHTPVEVSGLSGGVSAIAAGVQHTCALTSNGGVRCWGQNTFGQLGDGTTTDRPAPVEVMGLADVVTLAAGDYHTCAVTRDGGVQCWGYNANSQLGDGTTANRPTPVRVNGLAGGVSALAAGEGHTCAVVGGGVQCWGRNTFGQLGDGVDPDQGTPVDVIGLNSGVTAVATGDTTTCAAIGSGGAKCWGDNRYGQLGDGTNTDRGRPVDVLGLRDKITAFAVGGDSTYALTSGGSVRCWGNAYLGNVYSSLEPCRSTPGEVSWLTGGMMAIAAGQAHACALISGGGVKCWGFNGSGQLGDGTTTSQYDSPVNVSGLASGVTAITAGLWHTCALTTNGGVKCWGDNRYGQLGDGTNTNRNLPVDVDGLTSGVTAVAAGFSHTCALISNGGVKCWGYNSDGQLGDGTTTDRNTPVDVSRLTGGVTALALGELHTCALTQDGGVRCWGHNWAGQLGDGKAEKKSSSPVDVSGLTGGVTAIAAGYNHTCALTSRGRVKCWGWNGFGQLGNGVEPYHATPVQVVKGPARAPRPTGGFRPTGPLVPELTTHIPTPLDLSTDPAVILANLLLALAATILFAIFTVSSEVLNKTLAENEAVLRRWLHPARFIGRTQQRLEATLGARLGHPTRLEAIKLAGIVLFYGLVFSFLEKGWNPLSSQGIALFVSMTIAFGMVGIADDVAQWHAARRWGLPADLALRPANLLLAVASTTVSRILVLVPGIMFGTPEAFEVDKASLDRQKEAQLLKIAAATLLIIGMGVWLLTAPTTLLQRAGLAGWLSILIGGLESLLLLVFAVAVQAIFLQMLALPGSFGRALLRWNRWLWGGGLLGITFLFFYTLLNPRGDVTTALAEANVRFFFFTMATFVIGTLGVWLYFKWLNRREERKKGKLQPVAAPTPTPTGKPAEQIQTVEAARPEVTAQPSPPAETPPVAAPTTFVTPEPKPVEQAKIDTTGATKQCPACAQIIKAEARICRFCRARFEVTVKGYCMRCHAVVRVDENGKCQRCGGEVIDKHVESKWVGDREKR